MSFSGEKGLRVDRVIKCEPFDTVLNKSIKIAFTYKFFGEEDYYRAEYRFDIVKKGPRVVWIHKDNNQVRSNFIFLVPWRPTWSVLQPSGALNLCRRQFRIRYQYLQHAWLYGCDFYYVGAASCLSQTG